MSGPKREDFCTKFDLVPKWYSNNLISNTKQTSTTSLIPKGRGSNMVAAKVHYLLQFKRELH